MYNVQCIKFPNKFLFNTQQKIIITQRVIPRSKVYGLLIAELLRSLSIRCISEAVLEHSTPCLQWFIFMIVWNSPTTSLNRLLSSESKDKGLKLPSTTNPNSLPNLKSVVTCKFKFVKLESLP